MNIVGIISAFMLGVLTDFIKNTILDRVNEKKEKHILGSLINVFEKFTNHNNIFSIGPLVTNCIIWKGISKKDQIGMNQNQLFVNFDPTPKTTSPEMKNYIESNWKEKKINNPNIINELRCGVKSIYLTPNTANITFYESNYKNFIGTNKCISEDEFSPFITEIERKISTTEDGYNLLSDSSLANDLATATTIITKDNYVLLAKRSKEVFVLKNIIHTSIAEGMNLQKDWNPSSNSPDPFLTIKRGAHEELNLDIEIEDIEITSFGLYTPFMQPYITAKVVIDKTLDEVNMLLNTKEDTFEGNVFPVKNNLTNLSPFLFDRSFLGQNLAMADLGKISIVQCLLQKYGHKKLKRELIHTYKVAEKYF